MNDLSHGHTDRIVPSVFLVGAAKAGTTILWDMITQHPRILGPTGVKEPQYFLWAEETHDFDYRHWSRIPRKHQEDFSAYLDLYEASSHPCLLADGSVQYLAHPSAPRKIAAKSPEAKIIICLRDPVARAWSQFTYNRMRTVEREPDFMKVIEQELATENPYYAVSYVKQGNYAAQVKRWFDQFGQENVKVLLASDLRKGLEEETRAVFDFLGVERDVPLMREPRGNQTFSKHPITDAFFGLRTASGPLGNAFRWTHATLSKVPLYRRAQLALIKATHDAAAKAGAAAPEKIPAEAETFLAKYYSRDVQVLEQLIGRDLSEWKRATGRSERP